MSKTEVRQFVERGLAVAKDFLEKGNAADAARTCNEILEVSPGNRRVIKILEKAKNIIDKEKKELLKKNLPGLKKLYKDGKYDEALEVGQKLSEVVSDKKLSSLMTKIKKELAHKQEKDLKDFLDKGFKKHKELKREKKWLEAIEVIIEMQKVVPKNEDLKKMLRYDKVKYIDRQLHSEVRKELIEKGEYQKLYKFYQKLYLLFPEHKKLLEEIKNAEKLVLKHRKEENAAFIKDSIVKARDMLSKKEYEKAIKAAKEILRLTDGENFKGRAILEKAEKENEKDTESKLSEKLKGSVSKLKAEFKADPKAFVRL